MVAGPLDPTMSRATEGGEGDASTAGSMFGRAEQLLRDGQCFLDGAHLACAGHYNTQTNLIGFLVQ